MKAVRIDNGILLYYGNRIGRVQGEHAHVDSNFQNQRIIDFLKKQHVAEIEWKEGLYDRLLNTAADPEKKPKKSPYLADQAGSRCKNKVSVAGCFPGKLWKS